MAMCVLDWRAERRNTLRGFATIQFPSGIILAEIAVNQSGAATWATPPSRPWVRGRTLVLDGRGKPKYEPLITFATVEIRHAWSKQVIDAVREAYPDALDPELQLTMPDLLASPSGRGEPGHDGTTHGKAA